MHPAPASPLVPLLAVGALTAVGAFLISKKSAAAPALPAYAPPAPLASAPTMAAPAPAPAPAPEPAPSGGGSSDGGGGGGGGGSSASAPAASSGPSYTNPLATAAASGATAPTVSSMASRFVLPKAPTAAAPVAAVYQKASLADRAALAPSLSAFRAPTVYAAPTVRRLVPHGDFGGDVQSYAKENAPTMALVAGSGGILGWMLGKSVASAVLGAALAPVVIALGVTKLIDKKVG